MDEFERRVSLLLHDGVDEPPTQITAAQVLRTRTSKRRRWRMTLAPAGAVIAVAAIATVGVMLAGVTRDTNSPATSTQSARSTIYVNLTVRHPVSWRLVRPQVSSAGPSGPVAYLTNQRTDTQCNTAFGTQGRRTVTCNPPVTALRPNGVYIAFTAFFDVLHPPTSYNRVLDGHHATVQSPTAQAADCLPGATHAIRLSVYLPEPNSIPRGSGQNLVMSACYAGPDAAPIRHDINALIDSVTFLR
jgi:hypothetical protein